MQYFKSRKVRNNPSSQCFPGANALRKGLAESIWQQTSLMLWLPRCPESIWVYWVEKGGRGSGKDYPKHRVRGTVGILSGNMVGNLSKLTPSELFPLRDRTWEAGKMLSGSELVLLTQKTRVWLPAPMLGSSQLPVINLSSRRTHAHPNTYPSIHTYT